MTVNTFLSHILLQYMSVCACPIISGSQCWCFAIRANMDIWPKYLYWTPNSTSGMVVVSSIICQSTRKDGI